MTDQIFHRFEMSPDGEWCGRMYSETIISDIISVRNVYGIVHIYVTCPNGARLYKREITPSGAWSEWLVW